MAVRKALAGGLIRLAHRIYRPTVTEMQDGFTDLIIGDQVVPITVGQGGKGSTTVRFRGMDGSTFHLRGVGGGGGGVYLPPDDGPTSVCC